MDQSTYSIDKYQGQQKWCFAIVLNKAQQNIDEDKELLGHSLMRRSMTQKQEWFDKETQKLIESNSDEIVKRFCEIRNYFSHHFHSADCLVFKPEEAVRKILEKAYERAIFDCKQNRAEFSLDFPPLFEADGKLTSAGVVFFTSFFVERRYLTRLMGSVDGFKKTEGQYGLVRNVFSKYCLRDSHSVKGQDHNAVEFRNVLGYLLRIPSEAFQYYYPNKPNGHKVGDTILNERKTDKFISFALRYLEDFSPEGCQFKFARKQIERPEEKGTENKPHKKKAKVKVLFDGYEQDEPYYINHNNVILEITNRGGKKASCKVGVNELKYLVLLCLQGKGQEAVRTIAGYAEKIGNIDRFNRSSVQTNQKYIPKFVLLHHGIKETDEDKSLKNRKEYIRAKWQEKKAESKKATLHEKARDILQYINECGARPLNVDEYNRVFEILINRDFSKFDEEVTELIRADRLDKEAVRDLAGRANLEQIHQRACDCVLEMLEKLDGKALLSYIGLERKQLRKTDEQIRKEGQEGRFESKIKKLKPVICKGFLRHIFFKDSGKKFWQLVHETLKQTGANDVPCDEKYYKIQDKPLLDRTNLTLWETLSRDRLCVMIAWQYYRRLQKRLSASERIEWPRKDRIDLVLDGGNGRKTIRFSVRDFAKLYVMDDPVFVKKLFEYFFPAKTNSIDYHELYRDGLQKYSELQKECMMAILEFEQKLIDKKPHLTAGGTYVEFNKIVEEGLKDQKKKEAMKRVRRSIFHHRLDFERRDLGTFYNVMKHAGISRKWQVRL